MSSGRGIFMAGTILGGALGFGLGHFTLWGRLQAVHDRSAHHGIATADSGGATLFEPEFLRPDLGRSIQALTPLKEAVQSSGPFWDDVGRTLSPPEHAAPVDAQQHTFEHPQGLDLSGAAPLSSYPTEPSRLTPEDQVLLPPLGSLKPRTEPPALLVPDARPLADHSEESQFSQTRPPADADHPIRHLVDQELSGSSAAQREIWFESLCDLSHDDALNVLRMWKQFGGQPGGGTGLTLRLHLPDSPDHQPADIWSSPRPTAKVTDASGAVRQSIQIRHWNLVNLETPGFKRQIPRLLPHGAEPHQGGNELLVRIDWTPGPLQPTESPFDWAIDGEGFFVVTDGKNEYLTRNGHWTLDSAGQLILAGSSPSLRLVGDWAVPQEALSIEVSANGVVTSLVASRQPSITNEEALHVQAPSIGEMKALEPVATEQVPGGNESRELGTVSIARVLNPNGLVLLPNGLWIVTEASGPVQWGMAGQQGRGLVRQGFLEISNANMETESLAIEDLERLLIE